MKVHSFESFVQKAEEVYRNDPLSCRYTIKDAQTTDHLVLKVTDNKQCVIYELGKKSELWKLNGFNMKMMEWMATGVQPKDVDVVPEEAAGQKSKSHKTKKAKK